MLFRFGSVLNIIIGLSHLLFIIIIISSSSSSSSSSGAVAANSIVWK
jgi:hypothetical protein